MPAAYTNLAATSVSRRAVHKKGTTLLSFHTSDEVTLAAIFVTRQIQALQEFTINKSLDDHSSVALVEHEKDT